MAKILRVVKPFFVMEVGDTFELSANGEEYTSVINIEHHEDNDENSVVTSKYSSNYTISADYAKLLIDEGYLAAQQENATKKSNFVNVFDEIANMLEAYREDLNNLDEDMANEPACLKVEKQTVLTNMIKALEHLNSLKK